MVEKRLQDGIVGSVVARSAFVGAVEEADCAVGKEDGVCHCLATVGEGVVFIPLGIVIVVFDAVAGVKSLRIWDVTAAAAAAADEDGRMCSVGSHV